VHFSPENNNSENPYRSPF
jgi:hypothetical protein